MKIALVVIDMQKAFYQGVAKETMDSASEYINAVLGLFRDKQLPVVWVQDQDDEDGVVPGVPGYDLIESLKPFAGEKRINKLYGNSFNKTELASHLAAHKVDTVILSGYAAENCVLSTYRGALDQDLVPSLLKNGIASSSRENLQFVEKISSIISYNILAKYVRDL